MRYRGIISLSFAREGPEIKGGWRWDSLKFGDDLLSRLFEERFDVPRRMKDADDFNAFIGRSIEDNVVFKATDGSGTQVLQWRPIGIPQATYARHGQE